MFRGKKLDFIFLRTHSNSNKLVIHLKVNFLNAITLKIDFFFKGDAWFHFRSTDICSFVFKKASSAGICFYISQKSRFLFVSFNSNNSCR